MGMARGWKRLVANGRWALACIGIAVAPAAALAGYTEDPSGFWAVPTYQSISVYWNATQRGSPACNIGRLAATGKDAHDLFYDDSSGSSMTGQYRGSIVNLAPHTTYDIRLKRAQDAFWLQLPRTTTTWTETTDPSFPVKETIVLPASLDHFDDHARAAIRPATSCMTAGPTTP